MRSIQIQRMGYVSSVFCRSLSCILCLAAALSICLASLSCLSLYSSSRNLNIHRLSSPFFPEELSPLEVPSRSNSATPIAEPLLDILLVLLLGFGVFTSKWVVLLRGIFESRRCGPVGTEGEGLPPSIRSSCEPLLLAFLDPDQFAPRVRASLAR
ncbi:uncharacterized protein F4822DRAFT_360154 [Hypoxylon trugodes]|uniref:uncharacterized protein n=1 Tax=Hypoxylon trugodes TaxID=326681 RepID=UPI00219991ED|nr:uncharacterized protein F4822DRAFT_360154 [Hypoxylon trugodes]KAI1386010.1 hypothetical protein F4822DRAFT_360154 [Hypoxylon trugodes]